jgi:hypothetical protein
LAGSAAFRVAGIFACHLLPELPENDPGLANAANNQEGEWQFLLN